MYKIPRIRGATTREMLFASLQCSDVGNAAGLMAITSMNKKFIIENDLSDFYESPSELDIYLDSDKARKMCGKSAFVFAQLSSTTPELRSMLEDTEAFCNAHPEAYNKYDLEGRYAFRVNMGDGLVHLVTLNPNEKGDMPDSAPFAYCYTYESRKFNKHLRNAARKRIHLLDKDRQEICVIDDGDKIRVWWRDGMEYTDFTVRYIDGWQTMYERSDGTCITAISVLDVLPGLSGHEVVKSVLPLRRSFPGDCDIMNDDEAHLVRQDGGATEATCKSITNIKRDKMLVEVTLPILYK